MVCKIFNHHAGDKRLLRKFQKFQKHRKEKNRKTRRKEAQSMPSTKISPRHRDLHQRAKRKKTQRYFALTSRRNSLEETPKFQIAFQSMDMTDFRGGGNGGGDTSHIHSINSIIAESPTSVKNLVSSPRKKPNLLKNINHPLSFEAADNEDSTVLPGEIKSEQVFI
eukprot:CAMPEP_0115007112 /NCGR_PEP_ID=MMETSP0216-20121206/20949_1 /TAXON_ID=223996 /ORGANISM="Protocruzia adherens, Strain Boccale" /LENGTH=165 /DNA_ID=CAMNT_0002373919 /DNA_START=428 /DNA_END=925 /DNA_ORIENTATION=-